MTFDPRSYKITSMANWDVVAPSYHNSWAGVQVGPFKSTEELVELADIGPEDKVLDVACGTGVVSAAARRKLGSAGRLIGIDFSFGALCIAKSIGAAELVQMDAENLGLQGSFNRILCQYALMFFPDSQKVLLSLRQLLKPDGRIAVGVHGTSEGVPYFSTIMEPVQKAIPGIRPPQAPSPTRFGDPADFASELSEAGYTAVKITKRRFEYTPGTFEQYWSDYLATTANSIRSRIEADPATMKSIKAQAKERALAYSDGGTITFPWDILIATAKP